MERQTINNIILLSALTILSVLFFAIISKFTIAIVMAAVFAAMSQPIYKFFGRVFKNKPNLNTGLTLASITALIFVPLSVLIGVVVEEAIDVSQKISPWVKKRISEPSAFSDYLSSLPFYEQFSQYSDTIIEQAGQVASKLSNFLFTNLSSIGFSTLSFAFMFFIFIYTMFFFLRDGEKILDKILYYIPLNDADERRMINDFTSVSRATLKGTLVIGFIQGTLAGLGFWVAGIESPVFWGTIMIVLSIIPVIGSALIWIPACIILAANGEFLTASILAFYCGMLVGSVDNILRPRMVGRDTKMHELLILLSTIGGISVFGISGFIIGPIIAALFVTLLDIYGEQFKDFLPEVHPKSNSDLPNDISNDD